MYEMKVQCKNCMREMVVQVPRGVRFEDYTKGSLQKTRCENCGCLLTKVYVSGAYWNP